MNTDNDWTHILSMTTFCVAIALSLSAIAAKPQIKTEPVYDVDWETRVPLGFEPNIKPIGGPYNDKGYYTGAGQYEQKHDWLIERYTGKSSLQQTMQRLENNVRQSGASGPALFTRRLGGEGWSPAGFRLEDAPGALRSTVSGGWVGHTAQF